MVALSFEDLNGGRKGKQTYNSKVGNEHRQRTSFSITATRLEPLSFKMWLRRVVFPAPRNPVTCSEMVDLKRRQVTHAVRHFTEEEYRRRTMLAYQRHWNLLRFGFWHFFDTFFLINPTGTGCPVVEGLIEHENDNQRPLRSFVTPRKHLVNNNWYL